MKNKILQYMLLGCSLVVLFSACRKDPFSGKETNQSGKTFVYIEQAQQNDLHFLPFTDTKTVTVFTVRRDAASTADLQKSVAVTLTSLDLTAYNTANNTDYVPVPAAVATQTADPSVTTSATAINMSFAGGVFAKNYSLNINGSAFDPSKHYAMLLAITNFGGFSKMHAADGTSLDTILVTLGVKNVYDGDYAATGGIAFPPGTGGTDRTWDARDKTLSTIDASTSETEAADLGGSGYLMYLKVNADNTVTVTPSPASVNQTIQNNGDCTYDPATHTFSLHYKYVGGTGDRKITDVLVLK